MCILAYFITLHLWFPPSYIFLILSYLFIYLFIVFLWPHPWHVEGPRLGVKLELQLLACTTATAIQDQSHIFDLHHSSWQCWILNPLSKARDWTCILMDTSQICFHWATTGTPPSTFYICHLISSSQQPGEKAFNTCFTDEETEVQVLCVSAQKEFSERQSDRQEIDLLR